MKAQIAMTGHALCPDQEEETQGSASVFRIRERLIRQRTQTINALRGDLGEYGPVLPQGVTHLGRLITLQMMIQSEEPPRHRG